MAYTVEYHHEKADKQITKDHLAAPCALGEKKKQVSEEENEWVDKPIWEHKLSK